MTAKTLNIVVSRYFNLFIIILCSFFASQFVLAQSESDVSSILNSSDKKKIDKAEEYKNQADQLIEEANQLYMETFSVHADVSLDEKQMKKKVDQLESKAQQKQTEALELYHKGNEIKYGIYKQYMEKFWSEHEVDEDIFLNAKLIEEQSNDYYFQATTIRSKAEKLKDKKEQIQKLNDAYDLELKALEKQRAALGFYYSLASSTETPSNPVNQPVTQQPSDQPAIRQQQTVQTPVSNTPVYTPAAINKSVPPASNETKIDPKMIEMYNRYINDTTAIPEGFMTPDILEKITSFNADQVLSIWYSYIYNQTYTPDLKDEYLAQTETPEEQIVSGEETAAHNEEIQDQPVQSEKTEFGRKENEQVIAEIHEGEDEKASLIPADENIIYRVQIAANKSQLTQKTLRKMYLGQKNIEMINENGWYKYSIGDFDDYASANKFRKESGLDNAFIVAYRKGTNFRQPTEEQKNQLAEQKIVPPPVSDDNKGLYFRVQVAANRFHMRKEQLVAIYNGPYFIEEVEEEGWFKYQLPGVRLFSDALKIIQNVKVEGAFIIAYDNGTKIDLYEGVKRSIKIEKEVQVYGRSRVVNDIELFVQVAASKIPLSSSDLSQIYPNNQNLTLILEDGWYKYRVKAGSEPDKAKELKDSCNVKNAFIAAYIIGKKTTLGATEEKFK